MALIRRGKTPPLSITHPELCKEWDYEKNGDLTPEMVTAGSGKKVWWKGKCGHEWDAVIQPRTKHGVGCPYCAGKYVIEGQNDLTTLYPELCKEWNYEKNGDLLPNMVTSKTARKVWWKCGFGHEWEAKICNRANGRGCPYCIGINSSMPEQGIAYYLEKVCTVKQRIKINNKEIDVYLPDYNIGIEYNGAYFHKNKKAQDDLKMQDMTQHGIHLIQIVPGKSNIVENNNVIMFVRGNDDFNKDYEWALKQLMSLLASLTNNNVFNQISIDILRDRMPIRSRFDLYRKENSLAVKYPFLSAEWNYNKNGILMPDMFFAGSGQKVWWICSNGHEWEISISSRTNPYTHSGCPYCSNKAVLVGYNDLMTLRPDIAAMWNYGKNKELKDRYGNDISTPDKVTIKSGNRVWWQCLNCGYEWQATVANRTVSKTNCPKCRYKYLSNMFSKRVLCVETNTIYSNAKEAGRSIGLSSGSSISKCCRGERDMAGSYHWKYID